MDDNFIWFINVKCVFKYFLLYDICRIHLKWFNVFFDDDDTKVRECSSVDKKTSSYMPHKKELIAFYGNMLSYTK